MLARLSSLLRPAALATAALLTGLAAVQTAHGQPTVPVPPIGPYSRVGPSLQGPTLPNQPGASLTGLGGAPQQWMGSEEVVCPGGLYGGAFHPFGCRAYAGPGYYGFFRRYYGYAYYGPNYYTGPGGEQYGLGDGCLYSPRRACLGRTHFGAIQSPIDTGWMGSAPPASGANPPAGPADGAAKPPAGKQPAEKLPPPTDKAAHLQLIVPENAEVLVDGGKTRKTGAVRDFVSPPLSPGKKVVYTITVRSTGPDGKTTDDIHTVRVGPNDRFRIDCTRPATPEQRRAALLQP
jgi:uncharacterized protein (TIGR03000 family)